MTAAKTKLPVPEITYRAWNLRYKRPRQLGWPLLKKTGCEPAQKKPSLIEPRELIIHVRLHGDGAPEVSSVQVKGVWASTKRPVADRVAIEARPGQAFTIYTTSWIEELVADAISRVTEETRQQ